MSAYDDLCIADGAAVLWSSFAPTVATDCAGHDNGTIRDSPTLGQVLTGAPGLGANGVLLTTASSQNVDCLADGTNLPKNNGPFSMEIWVQITGKPAVTNVFVCNGSPSGAALQIDSGGAIVVAAMSVTNLYNTVSSGAINTAHHIVAITGTAIAGVAKPTTDTKLYLDGVDITPGSITGNTRFCGSITQTSFSVGSTAALANYCSGIIAKPAWYNVQLSGAQVLAHYKAGITPPVPVIPRRMPLGM